MIYRVVLDEITDILTPSNPLINPSLELEMNSAGSFNFTLPPDHPAWNEVFVLKTTVDVYEDNELIFTGRVANIDKNWNNERVVECEGALAYFNDSVQRPMKWENPLPIAVDPDDQPEDPEQHIKNFLEDILNNHNAFVPENRQIHMGHIYIDHCDVTREVEYDTTLDILTRMCIDTNGGWFMIRKDPTDHKLYLDWLKDFTQESDQKAQFGVNLLDFGAGVHAEDVCTGVLAKGAEVNDNTLLLTDVELVDETTYPDMSVTHYTDHDQDILWHREGVATFGEVVQVHDFSDAQTAWKDAHGEVVANSLLEVAKKWLEEKNTKVETFEIEVAELGWLDEGVPVFRLGQIVELNDAPHMTGEPVRKLPMYKLSCDLNSGAKKVTLGTPPKKELTQISASNSDSSTLSSSGSSSGGSGGGSGEECKVHDVRVDGTSVVSDKIANISLTGKADTSVVNALAATVATKADASAVVALADVVSGKQDQIEFNTQEAATEVLTRLKADNKVYNLGGGTEVVANPSEAATDDLETIKIGDTVYDIPGGGGSTNYGKFKCDVLFVNDPLPSPASGTGNVVRTYTLNGSIDDYDAVYIVSRGYYTSGNGSTNIVSRIIFKNEYYSTGFDGWGNWDGTSDNSVTRAIGYTFTDDTHIKSIGCRTESGQEPVLYKIYGLKFENKLINRSDIYSEDEVMIGRWTDGKPLYQRTVEFNFTSNTNDWTVFDTSVSYDRFIQAIAATKGVNVTEDQIMSYQDSSTSPRWCVKNDHKLYYYLENAPRRGAVTLQYTKTTDTPDSGVIPEDPMFISDPMIYSEEEQVVGSWTDGKPLYQKTITISSVSYDSSWHEVAHNISNIDTIGSVEGVVIESNGATFYPANTYRPTYTIGILIGADKTKVKYINNWLGSASKLIVTIQYTKTTDSILSGPKKGKIVQRSDIYSEEERLVGRWTDGRPLYQKTINFGTLPNNTTKTVSSGLTNVVMHNVFGVAIAPNGFTLTLPHSELSGTGNVDIVYQADNYVRLATDYNYSSYTSYITLQYTKSTDLPFSKQLIEDPQFVMMSDIYSEEEQVVGRWTDGKPIYQKTVIVSSGSLSSGSMNVPTTGITNVEKCIDWSCRLHSNSENRDFPIPYDRITYSESIQCLVHVLDDHTISCTLHSGDRRSYNNIGDICITFKYTKTTDAPGTGPTKGNLIYLPALYSEEEREVGVWTDGKPLYQKTWVKQLPASHDNDNYSFYIDDTSNLNIETQVSASGFLKTSDGSTAALNGGIVDLPGWNYGIHINNITKILQLYSYHQNTIFGNGVAIITIQYTKTTDAPGSGTWTPEGQLAHHYSTSEKVVGTWIDGSTIYEQVFALSSVITIGNDWTSTGITIQNASKILRADALRANGECCMCLDAVIQSGGIIKVTKESTGWTNVTHIILQYTKTS